MIRADIGRVGADQHTGIGLDQPCDPRADPHRIGSRVIDKTWKDVVGDLPFLCQFIDGTENGVVFHIRDQHVIALPQKSFDGNIQRHGGIHGEDDNFDKDIKCEANEIIGTDIHLDFPSVGATENIMLAAVLAEGTTIINNAAMEPEIIDLANCLNAMGAHVYGAGTNIIKIIGVRKLKGISYKIIPDRIEAGTFLCAGAITGGKVKINNVNPEHMIPIIHKLEECGCNIYVEKNSIELQAPKRLKSVEIRTMPYPGFPTDMQQIFGSMLTISKGTSIIIENIFENRYKYLNELIRMGAKIKVEGKTAVIIGKKKLNGTNVESYDLRGGAGLVVAALAAKGTSIISNIEYILRGYENMEEKLRKIGANIKQVGENNV